MSADIAPGPGEFPALDAAAVPHKSDGLVTRRIADETLVVPVRGHLAQLQNIYVLSEVGRHLWEEIDGARTVAALRDSLLSAYDVTEAQAERDLTEFLARMVDAGLLHLVTGAAESAPR